MAKRSAVLLLVLVSCCVCLSMSIEVKRSRSNLIAGETTSCTTNEKDKDIMEDCLKKYKLGFDNLGPYIPGSDPPSCAVDLVSLHVVNHFDPVGSYKKDGGCLSEILKRAPERYQDPVLREWLDFFFHPLQV